MKGLRSGPDYFVRVGSKKGDKRKERKERKESNEEIAVKVGGNNRWCVLDNSCGSRRRSRYVKKTENMHIANRENEERKEGKGKKETKESKEDRAVKIGENNRWCVLDNSCGTRRNSGNVKKTENMHPEY